MEIDDIEPTISADIEIPQFYDPQTTFNNINYDDVSVI